MSRTTPTPPSGPDPIKGTQPSVRVNPSNSESSPVVGKPTSDEFVIASAVQGVTTQSAAPAMESLASTVSGALDKIFKRDLAKGEITPLQAQVAQKHALGILGIDEPGGPIASA